MMLFMSGILKKVVQFLNGRKKNNNGGLII